MDTCIKLTEVRSGACSSYRAGYLMYIALSCRPCAVWRIIVGISLIPAFATLYHRLTLPEAKKFTDTQRQDSEEVDPTEKKQSAGATIAKFASDSSLPRQFTTSKDKKAHFTGMYSSPSISRLVNLVGSRLRNNISFSPSFLPLLQAMETCKSPPRHSGVLVPRRYCILRRQSQFERSSATHRF
jgi:hypothetical protein